MIFKNILFVFHFALCFSQQKNGITKKDYFIDLSDQYINIDFEKSLTFAEKALVEAKKENNTYSKAEAYYYTAKSYVFFRDFEQSGYYIRKGLTEEAVEKDIHLKALFLMLEGTYYSRMSLVDQTLMSNRKAFRLVESKDDIESKLILATIYTNMADCYTELKKYDSAHFYADKSIATAEKIPLERYLNTRKIYKNKPFIYFYKSWILLQQNKPHQAHFYIDKAYKQAVLEKIEYLALFYEIYGDYYYQIKNYQKAVDYYLLAADNKVKFKQNSAYVDSKIAKSYKILGDAQKEKYYLEIAENRHRIDKEEHNLIIQKELFRILEKEKTEKSNIQFNNNLMIVLITFLFSLLLVILVVRYQKIRTRKRTIIEEQKIKLLEKESEIYKKEREFEKLELKVNNSFSELNDMVKENSSLFWGRFQEIYSNFSAKMLEINPTLKVSELTFCAYIYLGFSNKEIAEYTFKSIRTIENNRYNLRKKIGLSTEEDFSLWLRKYIDSA
ncbi:hypothetical protein [Empedobacter brevis]|uniref:hypothetical protein n=1 Tax=Empedobacter brevis TaxID=247 RepID=UPI00289BB4B6|nr:hypothetical protein [Empedobacter brevis]